MIDVYLVIEWSEVLILKIEAVMYEGNKYQIQTRKIKKYA